MGLPSKVYVLRKVEPARGGLSPCQTIDSCYDWKTLAFFSCPFCTSLTR